MNTQLESVFNLDPHKHHVAETTEPEPTALELIENTVENLDKIDSALPMVLGLESTEREMDEIAKMAIEGYQQLMDLGMNVEMRMAAEIFGAASTLMGHALSAKTAKINKKLRMIELQLKKRGLDIKVDNLNNAMPMTSGTATVLDRNALLAEILGKKSSLTDK